MDVWREHRSTRFAVDRLKSAIAAAPDLLAGDPDANRSLRDADKNLEGTYILRLFAAFESALRSYDRAKHGDPDRRVVASAMIDEIGGRKGIGISTETRAGAHKVRRVRNHWAHESDQDPGKMSIDEARARLQRYLSELPKVW